MQRLKEAKIKENTCRDALEPALWSNKTGPEGCASWFSKTGHEGVHCGLTKLGPKARASWPNKTGQSL